MNPENRRFHSIYCRCMPILRIIARRCGVPYDEIDDVVQDTFVSFYTHYSDQLEHMEEDEVRRILVVTIRNRSIDYLRRKSAHPLDYWDPAVIQEKWLMLRNRGEDETLQTLLEKRMYRDVIDVLRQMREDWARLFLLIAVEERPVAEVSRQLGISQGACRVRMFRIRQYLRKELKRYAPKTPAAMDPELPESSGSPEIPDSS